MDKPLLRFGGQTGEEAKAYLALASLIRDRRGDPWLGSWEKGLIKDIEQILRSHGGRATLTDKQFDRVFIIFAHLDAMATVTP